MESPKSAIEGLAGLTPAFKKLTAITSYNLEASLGARVCVQVFCVQKPQRFAFVLPRPLRLGGFDGDPGVIIAGVSLESAFLKYAFRETKHINIFNINFRPSPKSPQCGGHIKKCMYLIP